VSAGVSGVEMQFKDGDKALDALDAICKEFRDSYAAYLQHSEEFKQHSEEFKEFQSCARALEDRTVRYLIMASNSFDDLFQKAFDQKIDIKPYLSAKNRWILRANEKSRRNVVENTGFVMNIDPRELLVKPVQTTQRMTVSFEISVPCWLDYQTWLQDTGGASNDLFVRAIFSRTELFHVQPPSVSDPEAPCEGICKTTLKLSEKVCWKCGWRRS
jgi:hypothetical protein